MISQVKKTHHTVKLNRHSVYRSQCWLWHGWRVTSFAATVNDCSNKLSLFLLTFTIFLAKIMPWKINIYSLTVARKVGSPPHTQKVALFLKTYAIMWFKEQPFSYRAAEEHSVSTPWQYLFSSPQWRHSLWKMACGDLLNSSHFN